MLKFFKKIVGWQGKHTEGAWLFSWGQVFWFWNGPSLKVYRLFGQSATLNIGLVFVDLFLNLPWPVEDQVGYGFSCAERGIHFSWGTKTKIWSYPWDHTYIRSWVIVEGTSYALGRLVWVELPENLNPEAIAKKWQFPYKYHLKSGEVQKRKATVYVMRREYRYNWLQWWPWRGMMHKSIEITFNKEVGERSGSWKGGVLGCGYTMLPGETPEQTLKRMEKEREM